MSPSEVAQLGEEIYLRLHKSQLEASNNGEFVAIDVRSEKAFVGQYSEIALRKAVENAPDGVFHLIKIGGGGKAGRRRDTEARPSPQWVF